MRITTPAMTMRMMTSDEGGNGGPSVEAGSLEPGACLNEADRLHRMLGVVPEQVEYSHVCMVGMDVVLEGNFLHSFTMALFILTGQTRGLYLYFVFSWENIWI